MKPKDRIDITAPVLIPFDLFSQATRKPFAAIILFDAIRHIIRNFNSKATFKCGQNLSLTLTGSMMYHYLTNNRALVFVLL